MKKYKSTLFKKHDLFELAEDINHKKLLRMEIKSIIDGVDEPDAQDYHILGLTYYFTQQDDYELNQAHEYFLASIENDNGYQISRLYIAHCHHDKKEYQAALDNYLLVNDEFVKEEFALWRYVKMLEQIGYCYHKIGNDSEARNYFNEVLKNYKTHDFDDLIFPVEVFQCLSKDDEIIIELKEIESTYFDS